MHVSPAFSHLHINGAFTEKAAARCSEELPWMMFVIKTVGIQQYGWQRFKEDL